jgi:hypothetical protein
MSEGERLREPRDYSEGLDFPLPENAFSLPKDELQRAFASDPTLTPTEAFRRFALTMNARDMAEWDKRSAGVTVPPRRRRSATGPSVSYSIRLEVEELAALEQLAETLGIKPTVLARNLIRSGLAAGRGDAVARAVDGIEQALAELRALVG